MKYLIQYLRSSRLAATLLALSLGACDVDDASEIGPPVVHHESPAHALVAEVASPSATIEALRPALRSLIDSVIPQYARTGRSIDRVALNVEVYRAVREGFVDRGLTRLGEPEVWPNVALLEELGYPAYKKAPRSERPSETTLVIRPGSLVGLSGSDGYLWAGVKLVGGEYDTHTVEFRIDLHRDSLGSWHTGNVSAVYREIH